MKSKLLHYTKEVIIFSIVMVVFANILSLYKSQSLNKTPLKFTELTLLGDTHYKLPNDKPILVHLWATWCPTCKLEASNIEFISQHFEVLTIAVNSGSDEDIKKFLKENAYSYRVVNDKNAQLASKFKIAAYPTTLIYDKNKNLIFSDVGYSSTFSIYLKMLWAGMK
jgi:thiol-disulfide isomerase/thioredoxin